MVKDAYEASWNILETLAQHGDLNANQIKLKTKEIGSKSTSEKALRLLIDDGLIQRDNNKIYSLNTEKFRDDTQALGIYEAYSNLCDNASKVMKNLEKRLQNHKQVLSLSDADVKLAKEVVRSEQYIVLINNMIRIFQLGSLMEFLINVGLFTKTIEKRAISLRRRNEKISAGFLQSLKKAEPVIWREIVMLVQTKITSKIDFS